MTIKSIRARKGGDKLTVLTAYDVTIAKILNDLKIDIILVGDSLGTAYMGYPNTLPVTVDDIIHHSKAVKNGAPDTFIVSDMPFLSYGASVSESVNNAGRIIKETGIDAVKLEGGREMIDFVNAITRVGIPVMGHIGLKPQSVLKEGYAVAGKTDESLQGLIEDALALESAGVFSIVLEGTTEEAAKAVTAAVAVPTIGIGAGRYTDGQVLVTPDMLGLEKDARFKHNKKYTDLYSVISEAFKDYIKEVQSGDFPGEENIFHKK